MAQDGKFQHDKKCPKCRKHKVYIVVIDNDGKVTYSCTACGYTWTA